MGTQAKTVSYTRTGTAEMIRPRASLFYVWWSVSLMSWMYKEKVCVASWASVFFSFWSSLVKSESTWLRLEQPSFEAKRNKEKNDSVVYLLIEQSYEVWKGKYLHIYYVSEPACLFSEVPFKRTFIIFLSHRLLMRIIVLFTHFATPIENWWSQLVWKPQVHDFRSKVTVYKLGCKWLFFFFFFFLLWLSYVV